MLQTNTREYLSLCPKISSTLQSWLPVANGSISSEVNIKSTGECSGRDAKPIKVGTHSDSNAAASQSVGGSV